MLFARQSRMSVSEIKETYELLNLKKYPIIHVAGTNGKGSCVEKISAALTDAGYSCGQYSSPHVATFRERIRISGQFISEEDVVEFLPEILECRAQHPLTFFEVITLLALLYFSKKNVDVAIVEVGLGGRLDATNCIDPYLTVISSISFDHQHLLGHTLEEIAFEKAGIIKHKVPLVLGPTVTQKSIEQKIKKERAPVFRVRGEFNTYDEENQAIAKESLKFLQNDFKISETSINKGVLQKPPCRFEKIPFFGKEVVLDMSHNEAGLRFLFKQVVCDYPNFRKVIFFSVSIGHDVESMASIIEKHADEIYIIEGSHCRLNPAGEIQKQLKKNSPIVLPAQARKRVESGNEKTLYLFIGSIFIMSEMKQAFGIDSQEDSYSLPDGSANFR
ncbi:MAG: hypothetical protein S4CHLAM7_07340 [Chlamydiae bacterium]|nr:hypothetical protein [Chlamydiota bacterium]